MQKNLPTQLPYSTNTCLNKQWAAELVWTLPKCYHSCLNCHQEYVQLTIGQQIVISNLHQNLVYNPICYIFNIIIVVLYNFRDQLSKSDSRPRPKLLRQSQDQNHIESVLITLKTKIMASRTTSLQFPPLLSCLLWHKHLMNSTRHQILHMTKVH